MTTVGTDPPLSAWGLSGPLTPLSGGHRNTVYRTAGPGPARVLKSTRRSEAAVAWLLPVLEAAASAGFLVPPPLLSQNGQLVVNGWTCEPWLEGVPSGADTLRALGPQLSAFHAATRIGSQRPGFLSARDLLWMEQGGDVDLSGMPSDLVSACREAWHPISEEKQCAIHGDLFAENVLCCPDGRFALIDWDEARRDVPGFDLVHVAQTSASWHRAHLAWEVACSWTVEPDYARQLAEKLLRD